MIDPVRGQFYQINTDLGCVICGPEDIPPVALVEPLEPEGWGLLEDVIEIYTKDGNFLEVYVYAKEGDGH